MRLGPLELSWSRKATAADGLSIDTVIRRLEAVYATASGIPITPETCEQSPTVKAVLTAITRRFAVMPLHVFEKSMSGGRTRKDPLPNHPVTRLLQRPNPYQTNVDFWMDASSWLVRYGNFYSFKARGQTGPIRRLIPLLPAATEPKQDDNDVTLVDYETRMKSGATRTFAADEIFHARLPARDGVKGDSPVMDVRESIALEIAAEKFGASFLGNGGMPGIVFKFQEGFQGFKTDEERKAFIDDFDTVFGGNRGRFRSILPPKGIELGTPIPVENDKAQFLQLRQLQRTIIAGAFGLPPHLVGDLSKGTFNNVEQQGIEFSTNVILPLCRIFEAAMERDLLTDEDRRGGVIIRFNPDGVLRGSFKDRQDGLAIQRQNGVISANDWRENEGLNPISAADGGNSYYQQGPSGQTSTPKPANGRGNGSAPPNQDSPDNQDGEDATAT